MLLITFLKYTIIFTGKLFSFEAGEILVVIFARNVKAYFNIIAEIKNILVFSKINLFLLFLMGVSSVVRLMNTLV